MPLPNTQLAWEVVANLHNGINSKVLYDKAMPRTTIHVGGSHLRMPIALTSVQLSVLAANETGTSSSFRLLQRLQRCVKVVGGDRSCGGAR